MLPLIVGAIEDKADETEVEDEEAEIVDPVAEATVITDAEIVDEASPDPDEK